MLFRVTSWLLLALAWTWLMLEAVPRFVVRQVHVDYIVSDEYLTESEYIAREFSGEDEGTLRFVDYVDPHPALLFVREHRLYVFVAGILIAIWCYLFFCKVRGYPALSISQR